MKLKEKRLESRESMVCGHFQASLTHNYLFAGES